MSFPGYCSITGLPKQKYSYWIPFLCFDTILLVLALYKGYESLAQFVRNRFSERQAGVLDILVKNSILYFLMYVFPYSWLSNIYFNFSVYSVPLLLLLWCGLYYRLVLHSILILYFFPSYFFQIEYSEIPANYPLVLSSVLSQRLLLEVKQKKRKEVSILRRSEVSLLLDF